MNILEKMRNEQNITPYEMGKLLGVTTARVKSYEKSMRPNKNTIKKYVKVIYKSIKR